MDQGPYELAVSGAGRGGDYIDLANTYLFVEAQIVVDDDTALNARADIGPVNLWMNSLFSDVSVSLNEKLVSPPTSLYPYRAYIETLLSYGPVQERRIKTKEIPSPERNTLKETPYLDSISHPTYKTR